MAANKFRVLYQFEVPFAKEVDDVTTSQDDQGNEVKTTKKVKKTLSRKACLKKPTRVEQDEALLYYNVMVSDGIKKGLIPRVNLSKIYDNDGGTMTDPEQAEYGKLYRQLYEKIRHRQQLSALPEEVMSEEDKKLLDSIIEDEGIIKRKLQTFEVSQSAIYDITAENRARTKTIMWWLVHLCYLDEKFDQDNAEPVWRPVFPGKEFEEKMSAYDDIEEGENMPQELKDFYLELIKKSIAACAFWYHGRASTQEDFENMEKALQESVKTAEDKNVPETSPSTPE